MHTANTPWWGFFPLQQAEYLEWQIGALALIIGRRHSELRTYYADSSETDPERVGTVGGSTTDPSHDGETTAYKAERHVVDGTEGVRILPALADRAIVSKPITPLVIHPKGSVQIYVSSPLWVRAELAGTGITLFDRPISRPSDTWFGINTRQGELAYASKTFARANLDLVSRTAVRAITPVTITNQSKERLLLEKISLPVPLLSLYADNANQLWTEAVSVTCMEQNEPSELTVEHGAPRLTGKMQEISTPRQSSRSTLIHSLNVLFGKTHG